MASKSKAAAPAAVEATSTAQKYKVNPQLVPLLRPITDFKLDPENRRKHGERNIQEVAASYEKFGQQKPIVVRSTGVLVAGEGQIIAAAQRLNWTHIAAITFDGSEDEAVAYGLVDNRSGESSDWDFRGLGVTLKALQDKGMDLSTLGWLPHEAMTIMEAEWKPADLQPLDQGHEVKHTLTFDDKDWKIIERVEARITRDEGEEQDEGEAVIKALKQWLK